jgi:MoaA/NifB/PqqE/SkfB family radical SAM enzyme
LEKIVDTLVEVAAKGITGESMKGMKLKEYSRFMTAPHRMDLMVSALTKDDKWNCTNNCVFCYASNQYQSGKNELSTGQWKRVIDICRQNGIPQLTFTGGEPTMRKDLAELIDYSKWFVTRLNTNGTLLTLDLCKRLHAASLDNVQVTLYSSDKTVHNALVGADTFDKTVEGIKNALKEKLDVSINTPLCQLNDDYVSTLQFAKELGVEFVTCSGLIPAGGATDGQSEVKQLSEYALLEILKKAKKFCVDNKIEIMFTSPGSTDGKKLMALGYHPPFCGACLSNMAVAPDGEVVPCQSWLDENAGLGNILKKDWEFIWESSLCKKIRAKKESALSNCLLPSRRGNEKI